MTTMIDATLFYYQLPFIKAMNFNGYQLKDRQGLILQLKNSDGELSYGEIAPLPGFSRETLAQAQEQIISSLNKGITDLSTRNHLYPSVKFGLDSALQGLSLNQSVNNLDPVPLLQGDNSALFQQYKQLNHPLLIKLKVARQHIEEEINLFNQLVNLNPSIRIRCDANQQWTPQQAEYFLEKISRQHLEYIEEPTANHAINVQLAEKMKIHLGLDETLQEPLFSYQYRPCIKALVIKPTLIGSIARVEQLIKIAIYHQLQVHISSSFESIIGLQQLAYLASTYQNKCAISLGTDTLKYFQSNLLVNPQVITADIQKLECIWKRY